MHPLISKFTYPELSEYLLLAKKKGFKKCVENALKELYRRADLIPTDKLQFDLRYFYGTK